MYILHLALKTRFYPVFRLGLYGDRGELCKTGSRAGVKPRLCIVSSDGSGVSSLKLSQGVGLPLDVYFDKTPGAMKARRLFDNS